MVSSTIEAKIFYRHSPAEVAGLDAAIIPLAEYLDIAVSWSERRKIRQILAGEYFVFEDAEMMRKALERAAKHARAHLEEYFPMMRHSVIASAEALESAIESYWLNFAREQANAIPTT